MKKSQRVARRSRQLFLETLERREVLAGNVAVALTNGALRITGDAHDNHIALYQRPNGRFDVVGLSDEVITGRSTNLIVRSILVNTGAGDDSVFISAEPVPHELLPAPAQVLGAVTVNTGAGSDSVAVNVVGRWIESSGTAVPSALVRIDTGLQSSGLQDDAVAIGNSVVSLLSVNTFSGNDTIDLIHVLALSMTIHSGVVATSHGVTDNDVVTLNGVAALNATVSLGASSGATGNVLQVETGLFGTLTVLGGSGRDAAHMTNLLAGMSLSIFTYGGADTVTVDTVQAGLTVDAYEFMAAQVLDSFDIDLSQLPFDLSSRISRLKSFPGTLSIFAGDGADVVDLHQLHSTFRVNVYLDAGNDKLVADKVEARFAVFSGGLGTDGRRLSDTDAALTLLLFEKKLPPLE